jgi:hypothetical protein
MQKVVDVQETASSTLPTVGFAGPVGVAMAVGGSELEDAAGVGAGSNDQVVPFHSVISPESSDAPASEPTAMQKDVVTQETLPSWLDWTGDGSGVGTVDHAPGLER